MTRSLEGRSVLADGAVVMSKTRHVLNSGDLAKAHGFTDVDGRAPHWKRYFREHFASMLAVTPAME